jgi:photosystem II stability/assembly factor-like uncharacterized protein
VNPRGIPARLLIAASIVSIAWGSPRIPTANAGIGPPPGETREPPPEKVPVEILNRIAREHTDRVPVGSRFADRLGVASTSGLGWTFLGPKPVSGEYWSGNADAAGRICSVAPHPTDPNVVYVAAAQGGVWKTTNGGSNWTPLTDQLSSLSSGWLTFEPGNPSVLYYATGEQHYAIDSYYGDGVFKTTDAGATWTKIAAKSVVGGFIARILVDPANTSRLFVASDLGIVRSVDGGANWSVVWSGGSDAWGNDLVFDPASSAVLYAAIYGVGILKSTDGGASWSTVHGGVPSSGFTRVNLAIAPSSHLVLYASFVDANGDLLGMYRTGNGGTSWSKLSATPNYLVGQGLYDNCLAVGPSDPNLCYAGGVFPYDPGAGDAGLIKTTNGGSSWTDVTIGGDGSQVHPDQHALAFGSGGLWVGCDGGVWKSADGGATWIDCNDDLAITQFYEVGLHPGDLTQMIAGTQDQGTLLYQNNTVWSQLVAGDGGPCGYDPHDTDVAFTTYVDMWYLQKFRDYAYQADVTGPWQSLNERASFTSGALAFDPHRLSTILVGTYRVWRSDDDGNTWSVTSPDLTNGGVLRDLTICPGVPGAYYASSSDGVVSFTNDNGATWQPRSTGLPVAAIPRVVVGPNDALTAYACTRTITGPRVFKTVNAGVTWTSITGNLPDGVSPHALAVDFRANPDKLYAGTDYGVWTSSDGGVTWIKDSAGLPNTTVWDLQLDLADDVAVAATHGRGMWRATLGVGPVAVEDTPTVRFALDPVRPQPVRGVVALQYQLPRAAAVALELFDVRGRKVQVIDAGWREAGAHQARWEGTDAAGARVPSGVYFARLSLGTERSTQRLVLVR